jgi:quercetin dioxygenase-like cupin family protein
MITRRDMNNAFALTALLSGAPVAVLRAQTAPAQPNPHGHMAGMSTVAVRTLMQEPLEGITNPEVTVITLTVAPGAVSPPHKHIGPVFAYILEGKIENQVDPDAPKTYSAGDFFYEPAMHVHRALRNLSQTEHAKLLIFQVGEKGRPFTTGAK